MELVEPCQFCGLSLGGWGRLSIDGVTGINVKFTAATLASTLKTPTSQRL
jgi:hypothetical protein